MHHPIRALLRGLSESVSIVVLFVAGGLGSAALLNGGALPDEGVGPALYLPRAVEGEPESAPRVWLVDGYNVLNVGLLAGREREGWWSARFRDELLGRVEGFEEREAEIWVAFDGQAAKGRAQRGEAERRPMRWGAEESRVRSVFAPSADEWLLARIRERGPGEVTLVTADRRLAARARSRGVQVVAPAAFLARCREVG
jgi:hypothetical protein